MEIEEISTVVIRIRVSPIEEVDIELRSQCYSYRAVVREVECGIWIYAHSTYEGRLVKYLEEMRWYFRELNGYVLAYSINM
mmetsp:Transcript_17236/g.25770  ORF Transcript_17236/g.25770 Transcript_17236/m.25770 type:complete len:81 (-) Transcript_17236:116-358(-)